MPKGVENVSNISEAKVYINLNGFAETTVNLNSSNIRFINVPEDKEVKVITQNLPVLILGSQAQKSKITSASVYGVVDMANIATTNGSKSVTVDVDTSSGATSTCWVNGSYAIQVLVTDKQEESASVSTSSDE